MYKIRNNMTLYYTEHSNSRICNFCKLMCLYVYILYVKFGDNEAVSYTKFWVMC